MTPKRPTIEKEWTLFVTNSTKIFFPQKQYQNHKHGDEWSLHHVNDSVRESAVFYNV